MHTLGAALEDLALQVGEVLFEYMSAQEVLRLSSTSRCMRSVFHNMLLQWIAAHRCRCNWLRKGRLDLPLAVTGRIPFTTFANASTLSRGNYTYVPVMPSPRSVQRQLHRSLCRECFCVTTQVAICATGNAVMLCGRCASDPSKYSALCSRAEARILLVGRVRGLRTLFPTLHVARRRRSSAHLYWRYTILQLANLHSQ
jgi:hypothetical protein